MSEEHLSDPPLGPTYQSGGINFGSATIGSIGSISVTTIPWQLPVEPALDDALALLDALPEDTVPLVQTLPTPSRMPFDPNPHFVGRDETLITLAQTLKRGGRLAIGPADTPTLPTATTPTVPHQKAVAAGLGGIGKTSVAAEFVHRYGRSFAGGVFWLNAADATAMGGEVATCGGPGLLDLHPTFTDLPQVDQVRLVQTAWQRELPRLLIFDNCEDPTILQRWAPKSGGCRVLITSRRQHWPPALDLPTVTLDKLARSASIMLLQRYVSTLSADDAGQLAEVLGDFPLALELAGSYLAAQARPNVAAYLTELKRPDILEHPSLQGQDSGGLSLTTHERDVGLTFLVSYLRLDPTRDALALALLGRAAYLAAGVLIPAALLLGSVGLAADDAAGQLAIRQLANLGLVTETADGVVLHRLIQAFVLSVQPDTDAQAAIESVLHKVSLLIYEAGYPAAMEPVVPHLWWAVRDYQTRSDEAMAALCNRLATHLERVGAYEDARLLLERALAITEQVLGIDHLHTAACLNNLAALYESMGVYTQAQPLYKRALMIHERILGADHPNTALCLNNLAYSYRVLGMYGQAQPLYERALAIRERVLGPEYPDTATSLNNLAGLYSAMRKYRQAQPLYERALAIQEQALGLDHPATATSLNNLAEIYRNTGEYSKAQPLYERALAIRERVLGQEHPDTATSLNNLALLYDDMGEYKQAQLLHERALAIREQVLGVDHPATAASLNNLAGLYAAIGEYTHAQLLYERTLTIQERILGAVHPHTATTQASLALLLAQTPATRVQGIALLQQALAAFAAGGHTYDAGGAPVARYGVLLEKLERGEPLPSSELDEQEQQLLIANTVAVLRNEPDQRDSWRQQLLLIEHQATHQQDQPVAELLAALLRLFDDQTADLPLDHPYAHILTTIQAALQAPPLPALSAEQQQAVQSYLATKNWREAQAVVEEHQAALFDPAVDGWLAAASTEATAMGNERAAASYDAHRQRFQQAQTDGIAAVFAEIPADPITTTLQHLGQGTLAALRDTPDAQAAWQAELAAMREAASDTRLVALIDALDGLLAGADPAQLGTGFDGAYAAAWQAVIMAIQTGGIDPNEVLQVANNTLAVILQVPDKREKWLAELARMQAGVADPAPAYASFLAACTALIEADGVPAGLGADLTPFYAGIWIQLVAALTPGAAGPDDEAPADLG